MIGLLNETVTCLGFASRLGSPLKMRNSAISQKVPLSQMICWQNGTSDPLFHPSFVRVARYSAENLIHSLERGEAMAFEIVLPRSGIIQSAANVNLFATVIRGQLLELR